MPKQEQFDIDERFGKEYQGHYTAREIPWAVHKEIIEKYTQYNHRTGEVLSINHTAIQAEFALASLKQPANKPITLEKLLGRDIETCIPPELAQLIEKKVNSVITISTEEKKNPAGDETRNSASSPN
jgi:hypothetical protein